jgi:hypothetical protein
MRSKMVLFTMIWPHNWFEWLWTVASILVLIDTPVGIIVYHRWIKHLKEKE